MARATSRFLHTIMEHHCDTIKAGPMTRVMSWLCFCGLLVLCVVILLMSCLGLLSGLC